MSEPPLDFDSLLEESQRSTAGSHDRMTMGDLLDDGLSKFLGEDDPVLALRLWLQLFDSGAMGGTKKIKLYLSQYVAQIDQLVSDQLNVILHNDKFQNLESRWRGVEKLIATASGYGNIKVRMLDVSWKEVTVDIDRASEFDQSVLFNLIYSQEFGIAGGEPFGVLLGDYEVSHRPSKRHPYNDINTLQGLAQIAAASFAPFICAAAPELFGLDSFESLANPLDFDNIFRQQEYTSWRSLRDMGDTSFLAITMPRILMRKPYKNRVLSGSGLFFNEDVSYKDSSRYLWGNACYAIGVVLLREFGDVGWFSHIRGAPRDHAGGGLVMDFPCIDHDTDSSGVAQKILTQMIVSDTKERMLNDHGFMSLCDCYDTPFAAFLNCPSLHKPKKYSSKTATANARLAAMLQQVLCASRFAHYIKVMVRDRIGAFTTAVECERMLQTWLNTYVTGREDFDWDAMSRYPLQSARVQVREIPGKPGSFNSIIHLKPQYIVDQLVSELKLTTELGQSAFGSV